MLTKYIDFVKSKIIEKIIKRDVYGKKARNTVGNKLYFFKKNYPFFLPINAKNSFHSVGK